METGTPWVTMWLSSGAAGWASVGREFNSCHPQRCWQRGGWDAKVELWGWRQPPGGYRGGHGKDTVMACLTL
eukprot:141426-Ditylum_brightwellii.AAC.1